VRKPAAAVLIGFALLVGACGSEPSNGAGPGASPDDVVSSTPGSDTPTPSDPQAGRVTPDPNAIDARPSAFEKVKVLGERKLRVFFYQGVPPCSVLQRVDVEYGTETIGIMLFVGHAETDEDVACIEIAVRNWVDVELDEAIHGRKIVDASA
jgi:hypothetical protein